jgi:hypothetical protein
MPSPLDKQVDAGLSLLELAKHSISGTENIGRLAPPATNPDEPVASNKWW